MNKFITVVITSLILCLDADAGGKMVLIPEGSFYMGGNGYGFNRDESPLHRVTISKSFLMGEREVTNAEYERFDPSHRKYRGLEGFSSEDDEAVVYVSWYDAVAYCEWLSEKEGRHYRLPTEAEWEYAAKAGSYDNYVTGKRLALEEARLKNNREGFHREQIFVPVNLRGSKDVAPNAFGLYDMNGNVEEWCLDWYGPYSPDWQIDPLGYDDGEFKVSRGGSHSTDPEYLRTTNRMAAMPSDRQYVTGFRVVCAPEPQGEYLHYKPVKEDGVRAGKCRWRKKEGPYFGEVLQFVRTDKTSPDVPVYRHNHQPSICWCPNGDLLAIWFSTEDERGREMVVLQSRLKRGQQEWTAPSLFFKVPDRNMTGSSLFYDESVGAVIHLNGVEATGWWRNLAVAMRKSFDNGASWSKPELVMPEHTTGHQLIAGMSRLPSGELMQVCDATPAMSGGSVIWLSGDGGETWRKASEKSILGIHAGAVGLLDGRILAFGRGVSLPDSLGVARMPVSVSSDGGQTWEYGPSCFPPIGGGQRLVLMRLLEGPLFFASFENDGDEGRTGLFVSVSYDEGKNWSPKVFVYNGEDLFLDGGGWTGYFQLDALHSEPKGYLTATQTPDGIINLISSKNHYRFNLGWIESKLKSL